MRYKEFSTVITAAHFFNIGKNGEYTYQRLQPLEKERHSLFGLDILELQTDIAILTKGLSEQIKGIFPLMEQKPRFGEIEYMTFKKPLIFRSILTGKRIFVLARFACKNCADIEQNITTSNLFIVSYIPPPGYSGEGAIQEDGSLFLVMSGAQQIEKSFINQLDSAYPTIDLSKCNKSSKVGYGYIAELNVEAIRND